MIIIIDVLDSRLRGNDIVADNPRRKKKATGKMPMALKILNQDDGVYFK